jgi:NAD-dependent dihydropyrimidine dehydrogenase PreA subunit
MNWRNILQKEARHLTDARKLQIYFDPEKCTGVWQCYEVCPTSCWAPDMEARKATFHDGDHCIACGACVLQCPEGAIELRV